jgi:hypothetical protein
MVQALNKAIALTTLAHGGLKHLSRIKHASAKRAGLAPPVLLAAG